MTAVAVSPCGRLGVMAIGSTVSVFNMANPQGGALASAEIGTTVTTLAISQTSFLPSHEDDASTRGGPRASSGAGAGAGAGAGPQAGPPTRGENQSPLIVLDRAWRDNAAPGECGVVIAGTTTGVVAMLRIMDARVMAPQRREDLHAAALAKYEAAAAANGNGAGAGAGAGAGNGADDQGTTGGDDGLSRARELQGVADAVEEVVEAQRAAQAGL